MRPSFHLLLFVAACCGIYAVPACDDSDPPATNPNADVVYEGAATDEAFESLTKAPPSESPTGPKIADPVPGTFVYVRSGDPPAIFSWSGATGSRGSAPPRSRGQPVSPVLFGGERVAWAHGPSLSGRAFLLIITAPTLKAPLRVFTTAATYQPSVEVWSKLTGDRPVEFSIQLALTAANFESNALVEVPVRGPTVSVTLRVQAR